MIDNNSRWAVDADGIKKKRRNEQRTRERGKVLENCNRTGNEHVACEWGMVDHMSIMDCN